MTNTDSDSENIEINEPDDTPVVLVPGFLASRLWSIPLLPLTPPVLAWPLNAYSLTAQMFLLRARNPLEPDGLVKGYYEELVEFITRPVELGGLGRREGYNFWLFPYDWRQSCLDTGRLLAQFIQNRLAQVNSLRQAAGQPAWTGVDVIGHSMGGLVSRTAQQLYNAPLRRAVYIATPHYGAAKAFFFLHPDTATGLLDDFITGFIPNTYWQLLKSLPNVLLLQQWLLRLLSSFQSVYELLPDEVYLAEEGNSLIQDATHHPPRPVTGLENSYYRHPWQLPLAQQARVRLAMRFKEQLGRDVAGEHNLAVYAAGLPTSAQANYVTRLELPQELPCGDSTVPAASARPGGCVQLIQVEAPHARLPGHPEVLASLRVFYELPPVAQPSAIVRE